MSIKKWLFLRFNKCLASFPSIVAFLGSYYTFDDAGFRGSKIGPNPIGFYTWFWKKKVFLEILKFFHECGGYISKIIIFCEKRLFLRLGRLQNSFSDHRTDFMKSWNFAFFFFQILTGNQAKIFIAKNSLLVSYHPS